MSKDLDYPVTPAVRVLRASKIAFSPHLYEYVERGGTAHSGASLGVDEHVVIKTIVLEDDRKKPLICLQHGDREVSTKNLARAIGVKTITPCAPETALRYTGYMVGGTSPFGTKREIPIYLEKSIVDLPLIYINGGKRGFLVSLTPRDLIAVLAPVLVDAAAS
jgi:Cys-tRNA(Pro) deacylase